MSALDQAFIRAYNKKQSEPVTRKTVPSDGETDPATIVENACQNLVLHDLFSRGDLLRFDVAGHDSEHVETRGPQVHVSFPDSPPVEARPVAPTPPTELAAGTGATESLQRMRTAAGDLLSDLNQALSLMPTECQRDDRSREFVSHHSHAVPGEAAQPVVEPHGWSLLVESSSRDVPLAELTWRELIHAETRLGEADQPANLDISHQLVWISSDDQAILAFLAGGREDLPAQPVAQTDHSVELATNSVPAEIDHEFSRSLDQRDESLSICGDEHPARDGDADQAPASAWEVDGFRWPTVCEQLLAAHDGEMLEAGKQLLTASREGLRVVAITGTQKEVGRSTLAMTLSLSVARAGGRVALLDVDLPNPQLAQMLGIENSCDWFAVASQQQPAMEAGVASLTDGVTLFPLAGHHETPDCGKHLDSVVRQLRRSFDLIVADMPSIGSGLGGVWESGAIQNVDMALIIRRPRLTTREQTVAAADQLRKLGIPAIGVVENGTADHQTPNS
jgi:Mrp family chromosome partitioning ATPase